jgi:hypothetical protein
MKFNYKIIIKFFNRLSIKYKYAIVIASVALLLSLGLGIYKLTQYIAYNYSKQVYEVAVMIRNQKNSDPIEDARSSLKYGDVLVIKEKGHQWSEIEKISYLIIKIELNRSQVQKITQSKYQKEKYENLDEEGRRELNDRLKSRGLKDVPLIIVNARQYRINMEKYFKDFDPVALLYKQLYQDKIFDWSVVEKK